MGLFDQIKMLLQHPVSYGNVQNQSYEETPQRNSGGGWGFGTSSAFQRPQQQQQAQQQQPDLEALLAAQRRLDAIPQAQGPVQQPNIPPELLQRLGISSPLEDALGVVNSNSMGDRQSTESLDNALAVLNARAAQSGRQIQRPQPQSYDYDAVAQFAGPAYTEGPNANIQDDSRARAMAWLAAQQGNQ